jgi:LCP family protein required for cell wall assembly
MDNFKVRKPKSQSAVDGMMRSASRGRKVSIGDAGSKRSKNRLDDFAKGEGFHTPDAMSITDGRRQSVSSMAPTGRKPRRDTNGKIDLSLAPEQPKKRRFWQRRRKWRDLSRKQKIKRTLLILLALMVIVGGFLFAKGYLNLRNIFKGGGSAVVLEDGVDPNKLRGEGDGRVNVLMLGRGGGNHTAPDLTDTILVASLDPINKKAGMLSIPRDLWVTTEDMGGMKINAVFAQTLYAAQANGKSDKEAETEAFAAIEKVVSDSIGIPIHYHAMIDFAGFEKAINTVGGVDIYVDANGVVYEQLWDETTGQNYVLNVREGWQKFDGKRALFYARSRYTSERGDFDRAERQRKILLALKDKVLSAGTIANPARLSALISNFGGHIQTNMTIDEMMQIYGVAKDIGNDGIKSISLVDEPNVLLGSDFMYGQSVLVPTAGIDNFTAIQSFVRNTLKDGFIEKENPEIIILNGTTIPGLAQIRADELKSYGYRVTKIDDAPTKNYAQTVFVNLRGDDKKYTQHYLQKRLGVGAVGALPDATIDPGLADFVIIVGRNEANL